MTSDEQSILELLVTVGAATLILLATGGIVWAAVLLLRRAPNAQHDAFTFANGMMKTNAELATELREDSKRREAANAAHIAAFNAATDALRGISAQQAIDSATIGTIAKAVTTEADHRHTQVMTAISNQTGFYPALIEEFRMIKSQMHNLDKTLRKRKYSKPAPIRGALQRIEKQLERFIHAYPVYPPYPPNPPSPMPSDWREFIYANYGASANGKSHAAAGWDTNDA